jgi:hypothetical protein
MGPGDVAPGEDHHHQRGADGQWSQGTSVVRLEDGHADGEDQEEGADEFH